MPYNNFGLTVASVVNSFVTGSIDATQMTADLGGNAIIQDVMDDVTYEVVNSMCDNLRTKLGPTVELEQLSPKGGLTDPTASLTLGLTTVTSVTSLWQFASPPYDRPNALNNISTDYYSTTITDGVATITGSFDFGEATFVYVTYEIDTDSADYSIPSIAAIVKQGVVARIGNRVYSDENSWNYIKVIKKDYDLKLEKLSACDWVPVELKKLNWWKSPHKAGGASTIPWYRS